MIDNVEVLTLRKSQENPPPSRDVKKVLSELPVQSAEDDNMVLDSIAAEKNDATLPGGSRIIWLACAIGVVVSAALALALIWTLRR